ncbi:hypothetical protein C8R47DRAFT_1230753 [Mycena vitilis]|nr:hypothetical protein C8R47DRAFT_1230753 [Mycena vitilis]
MDDIVLSMQMAPDGKGDEDGVWETFRPATMDTGALHELYKRIVKDQNPEEPARFSQLPTATTATMTRIDTPVHPMSRSFSSSIHHRSRRVKRNLIFLDVEARVADGDDDDEVSQDEEELDFIDKRALADDPEDRRPRYLSLMDDASPCPEAQAEAIIARHRALVQRRLQELLTLSDSVGLIAYQRSLGIFDRQVGDELVPRDTIIWRLHVQRGHEDDVVRTCMRMVFDGIYSNTVKSVLSPCSTTGSVYVETCDCRTVIHIQEHVAFVYRSYHPYQIPAEEYKDLLSSKDPKLLASGTWGRVKRKGPYNGDLVWIHSASEYKCTYDVWMIPRAFTSHDDHDGLPPPTTYYLLNGKSSPWAKELFFFELLVQTDVPLHAIVDDQACPTIDELREFQSTHAAQSGLPQCSSLTSAVNSSASSLLLQCSAGCGDIVRVLQGSSSGLTGTIVEEPSQSSVLIQIDALSPSPVSFLRSDICVDFHIGSFVHIDWGDHKGLLGWVVDINWGTRRATVHIHHYMPFTDLARDVAISDNIVPTQYIVDCCSLRIASLFPTMKAEPKSKRIDIPRAAFQQFVNKEVRIVKGPLRGIYGIIKSTELMRNEIEPYLRFNVFTDGRSVNNLVACRPDELLERHTALPLLEYMTTPHNVRTALRSERERLWASDINNGLTEQGFLQTVDLSDTWAEIWPTQAELRDLPTVADHAPAPRQIVKRPKKATVYDAARDNLRHGCPGGVLPGSWLTQQRLKGLMFDVVIRNASNAYSGRYDNHVGVLTVPNKLITMGNRNNSLEVSIGRTMATRRSFKLWHIFPLTTTQFEGYVDAKDALSVLDAPGTHVVIIGPAVGDSTDHVGKMGTVGFGRMVQLPQGVFEFEEKNLCRSDPLPHDPRLACFQRTI